MIRKHYKSYRQNIINNKEIYYNNLCFNKYLKYLN